MKNIATLFILAGLLSGCVVAPTREDVDKFKLMQSGTIAPKHAVAFAQCLLDGFDKSHTMLMNITNRQQRRTNSFRVESMAGRNIIISADVFDDGKVRLFEANAASLINTSGEREAFNLCLKQYEIAE